MEEIYTKARELGITIYPYQKQRLDDTSTNHIADVSDMEEKDFKDYLKALYNVQNEHAGGYDGWSSALETFIRLGAIESEERIGHMVFKSVNFNRRT